MVVDTQDADAVRGHQTSTVAGRYEQGATTSTVVPPRGLLMILNCA